MATFLKYSLLLSLLLLLSLQIQAREVKESHFFNKFTRENPVNIPEIVAAEKTHETIPKQEDPIDFATKHSSKGHGLYGNDENNNEGFYNQNQNYHSTFNYDENNNNKNFNNNFNEKYSSNEYSQEKNYNPRENNNNFNNFDAKYSSNEYNQDKNYNPRENNYVAKESKVSSEFADRPYGMSDTRFLENGKYFYDVNAEKRNNLNDNFESTRGNNMGYYGSSQRRYNKNNNYYNNNVDSDEFDNAMNRYRNRGEEVEDEFEP